MGQSDRECMPILLSFQISFSDCVILIIILIIRSFLVLIIMLTLIIPDYQRVNYPNYLNYQGFLLGCRAGLQLELTDDGCSVRQS